MRIFAALAPALQLMGLKAGEMYRDSVINQVFDELMATPPEPGYSKQAVDSRNELLEIVRTDIITSKGRSKEAKEVTIPYDLLPGALAVMAEVRSNACMHQHAPFRGGILTNTHIAPSWLP